MRAEYLSTKPDSNPIVTSFYPATRVTAQYNPTHAIAIDPGITTPLRYHVFFAAQPINTNAPHNTNNCPTSTPTLNPTMPARARSAATPSPQTPTQIQARAPAQTQTQSPPEPRPAGLIASDSALPSANFGFVTMFSIATAAIEIAISGSMTRGGATTSPVAASASVTECASVNVVTKINNDRNPGLARYSPRMNNM